MFRRVLLAVTLALGPLAAVLVADAVIEKPQTAHAWLYNCYAGFSIGSSVAICNDHFNNGGLNQVRAVVNCQIPGFPGTTLVGFGPWKPEDSVSRAYCPQPYYKPVSASYQLR